MLHIKRFGQTQWLWPTSAVVILTLSQGTSGAGTRLGDPSLPGLLFHIAAPTSKQACSAQLPDNCAEAVVGVNWSPGTHFYNAYLLVGNAEVRGLQCEIFYNAPSPINNGQGIDILQWNLCASAEFHPPGPVWPEPGSGIVITWSQCQEGPVTAAGYFYLSAYGRAALYVSPPISDMPAMIADCSGFEMIASRGYTTFDDVGCNPCLNPCCYCDPAPSSTWGAIKSLVGQ